MSKHKIKIIETANEVYWATTHQGTWKVDGQEITFRFHENSKGCDFYVFNDEDGWVDMYDMDPGSPEDTIFNMCLEMNAEEWGEAGEELIWEGGEL